MAAAALTFDLPVNLDGGYIYGIRFSPYKWSHNYVAVYSRSLLSIGNMQMSDDEERSPTYVPLYRFKLFEIIDFVWLCDSQINVSPIMLKFAVCHKDGTCNITVFTLHMDNSGIVINQDTIFRSDRWIFQITASPQNCGLIFAILEGGKVCLFRANPELSSSSDSEWEGGEQSLYIPSARYFIWHPLKTNILFIVDRNGILYRWDIKEESVNSTRKSSVFRDVCSPFINGVQIVNQRENDHSIFDLSGQGDVSGSGEKNHVIPYIFVSSSSGVFRCEADEPDSTLKKVSLDVTSDEEIRQLLLHPASVRGIAAVIVGLKKKLKLFKWDSGKNISEVDALFECQALSWHLYEPWLLVSSGNILKIIIIY